MNLANQFCHFYDDAAFNETDRAGFRHRTPTIARELTFEIPETTPAAAKADVSAGCKHERDPAEAEKKQPASKLAYGRVLSVSTWESIHA